jgi:hypothetical protein
VTLKHIAVEGASVVKDEDIEALGKRTRRLSARQQQQTTTPKKERYTASRAWLTQHASTYVARKRTHARRHITVRKLTPKQQQHLIDPHLTSQLMNCA